MMTMSTALIALFAWGLSVPALLGLGLMSGRVIPIRTSKTLVIAHSVGLLALTVLLGVLFAQNGFVPHEVQFREVLREGDWAWLPVLLVDNLSMTYAGLVALVYAAIVRFSLAAMVREAGARRYWFFVTLFVVALLAAALAGNIDVFYLGWELVGITSVMLIAFFRQSVRSNFNSLRTLIYYRIGDLFLLGAAIEIHHAFPAADFSAFARDANAEAAGLVAFALLVATLAKSAQLPMSPWLHRAMEGPAASSGVFYGALSVHLGPFLLLRTSPLWMSHAPVRVAIVAVGLCTAVYARLVGRTRPDAKTSLAYATMAQIGIIFVEIGIGLHTLALVHVCAHASLRTWQFLRSSSLIQDFQENPSFREGVRLTRVSTWSLRWPRVSRWLYIAALRQFWLDGLQWQFFGRPLVVLFGAVLRGEQRLFGTSVRRAGTVHIAVLVALSGAGYVASHTFGHGASGEWFVDIIQYVCVLSAILHAGMGLSTRDARRSLLAITLSQAWLVVAGAFVNEVGRLGAVMMLLGVSAGAIVLSSILSEIHRRFGVLQLAPDNGLAEFSPRLSAMTLVMGWMLVGLPGGITFFAEDVMFHALLEHSSVVTMGFLIASAINPVVFYRMYIGLFSGLARPEVHLRREPALSAHDPLWAAVRLGLTLATLVLGLRPAWFF